MHEPRQVGPQNIPGAGAGRLRCKSDWFQDLLGVYSPWLGVLGAWMFFTRTFCLIVCCDPVIRSSRNFVVSLQCVFIWVGQVPKGLRRWFGSGVWGWNEGFGWILVTKVFEGTKKSPLQWRQDFIVLKQGCRSNWIQSLESIMNFSNLVLVVFSHCAEPHYSLFLRVFLMHKLHTDALPGRFSSARNNSPGGLGCLSGSWNSLSHFTFAIVCNRNEHLLESLHMQICFRSKRTGSVACAPSNTFLLLLSRKGLNFKFWAWATDAFVSLTGYKKNPRTSSFQQMEGVRDACIARVFLAGLFTGCGHDWRRNPALLAFVSAKCTCVWFPNIPKHSPRFPMNSHH